MSNFVRVGKLSYSRTDIQKGQYGKVYKGYYEDLIETSILRVDKSEVCVDKRILRTTDLHPNILRFFGTEEEADGEYQ